MSIAAIFLFGIVVISTTSAGLFVSFRADDEFAGTCRNKLDEDLGEGLGNLFECTDNGLVFALIENVDELFNGLSRGIEFGTTIGKESALLCEILMLFESFFIYM
jgi:hypothetical protein